MTVKRDDLRVGEPVKILGKHGVGTSATRFAGYIGEIESVARYTDRVYISFRHRPAAPPTPFELREIELLYEPEDIPVQLFTERVGERAAS